MQFKKSRTRAEAEWVRKNTRRFMAVFSDLTDGDVIERLKAQDNKQGYMKRLIRADIARGKGEGNEPQA